VILLITGYFSTSAKFCRNIKILRQGQIPQPSLKFCGLLKTVRTTDAAALD